MLKNYWWSLSLGIVGVFRLLTRKEQQIFNFPSALLPKIMATCYKKIPKLLISRLEFPSFTVFCSFVKKQGRQSYSDLQCRYHKLSSVWEKKSHYIRKSVIENVKQSISLVIYCWVLNICFISPFFLKNA